MMENYKLGSISELTYLLKGKFDSYLWGPIMCQELL